MIPAAAINRLDGHQALTIYLEDLFVGSRNAIEGVRWADVVVIERNFFGRTRSLVQNLKRAGKLVIGDFDDAYHLMPKTVPSSPHWNENKTRLPDGSSILYKPGYLNEWIACLAEFHAFHTPSRLLTQDWLHINSHGYVVNNYPDYNWPSWSIKRSRFDVPIVVAWGGGGSHLQSFTDSKIIPALKLLCDCYSEVMIGVVSGDERIRDCLGLGARLTYHRGGPPHGWPAMIPEFDIAYVPLAGDYDDRRSWIKVLESSAQGVPWVAVNHPPYYGCKGGYLIEDRISEWVIHLGKLIESKALRLDLGAQGRSWARKQGIDARIEKRLGLYGRLFGQLKAGALDKKRKRRKGQKRKGKKK